MFFLEKKQQKSKKKNLENLIFFLFFCIKILIFCLFFLSFYHETCILTGLFTLIVKYTLFLVLLFVQMFSSHLTTKNTTINEKKFCFFFVFFCYPFFCLPFKIRYHKQSSQRIESYMMLIFFCRDSKDIKKKYIFPVSRSTRLKFLIFSLILS